MSTIIPPAATVGAGATAATDRIERLRQSTSDLEGVFVEQLFKAMRETVPRDGLAGGGSGEEMFTGLLDQKMASVAPSRWQHGLSDALLRQLRGRLEPSTAAQGAPASGASPSAPPAAPVAPVATSSPPALAPILIPNALSDASRPEPS